MVLVLLSIDLISEELQMGIDLISEELQRSVFNKEA